MASYFYSGQIRRFLAQFIRIMSGYQVAFGRDANGKTIYRKVPCTYGDPTRQAAQILRANSTNTSLTVPQISCYITDLKYERDRMQEPNYVKKVSVIERAVDPVTGNYTNEPGNRFTVERLMPVPYELTLKADIWTSSTDQKLQLLEQICSMFNPSMEIQSTDNFLDWTSLSRIELESTSWSSRSIPVGAEDAIDVSSLTFSLPIWLSAPAKVKRLGVITNIITDLYDASGALRQDLTEQGFVAEDFLFDETLRNSGTDMSTFADPLNEDGNWYQQVPRETSPGVTEIVTEKVSPRNKGHMTSLRYDVVVLNGVARLYQIRQGMTDEGPNGDIQGTHKQLISWDAVLVQTQTFLDGISKLYLKQSRDLEVVGTVSLNSQDKTELLFSVDVDSIPSNTLPAVDRIIDPRKSAPGSGLPTPVAGQRYLLLNGIGNASNTDGADAWKATDDQDLVAAQYDIIEYDGDRWIITFSPVGTAATSYVTNLANGQQFKWTGTEWLRSWEGLYVEGEWRLA